MDLVVAGLEGMGTDTQQRRRAVQATLATEEGTRARRQEVRDTLAIAVDTAEEQGATEEVGSDTQATQASPATAVQSTLGGLVQSTIRRLGPGALLLAWEWEGGGSGLGSRRSEAGG